MNGFSIVKVGRDSGFIAAGANPRQARRSTSPWCPRRRSNSKVNEDCWPNCNRRLPEHHHALIVVAEGAGANLMPPADERDASGNLKHRASC